ncbi:MAG: hypothetical protein JJU20_00520 [Opitutales bacterium]|nr:hypothetical protein [Opitutales bacterium]
MEQRIDDEGNIEVRLKSLAEFRGLFEEKNRFLLLEGVEITQSDPSIHINAYNVQSPIEPIRASSVEETIRQNVEAVNKTSRNLGRPTLAQLNHPNFRNATTAEGIAPVENLELIEVYNGFRGAVNFGSEDGVLEVGRVWDIVLTKRIAELGLGLVYATGVDDTHNYETSDSDVGRPGRGWICVSCSSLSSETIIDSIRKGHFYASNGVSINSISVDASHYTISVEAEAGVDYRIRFIGTRKGYDPSSEPFRQPDSQIVTGRTRIYSSDIGEVLAEYEGHEARYEFQGDELYVRAEVLSSRLKSNYSSEGEIERAWMQPVIPGQLA